MNSLPRCVFVEVTNKCNLQCSTCPHTFVSNEKPRVMGWDEFVRIVEQFHGMQRAVLHGIGEPLLNRDLPRMVSCLKQHDVTVLFNTNAVLLDERWGRALIESGLDELRVSLDSPEPNTYELIRGAPTLHKVVDNLRDFMQLQRSLGTEKPRVSVWMTGMRENIEHLPDLVRLAAQIGVPEVYVQRMVYFLDADDPPGWLEWSHAIYEDFDRLADRAIAEAEVVAHQQQIVFKASGATDPRSSFATSRAFDQQPWSACLRPWTTAYITASGNCLPCCIAPFASTDYESLKMGNLFERDFDSIWNDERYRAWRQALLSPYPPAACRGCGIHWSL